MQSTLFEHLDFLKRTFGENYHYIQPFHSCTYEAREPDGTSVGAHKEYAIRGSLYWVRNAPFNIETSSENVGVKISASFSTDPSVPLHDWAFSVSVSLSTNGVVVESLAKLHTGIYGLCVLYFILISDFATDKQHNAPPVGQSLEYAVHVRQAAHRALSLDALTMQTVCTVKELVKSIDLKPPHLRLRCGVFCLVWTGPHARKLLAYPLAGVSNHPRFAITRTCKLDETKRAVNVGQKVLATELADMHKSPKPEEEPPETAKRSMPVPPKL